VLAIKLIINEYLKNNIMILSLLIIPLIGVLMLLPIGQENNYGGAVRPAIKLLPVNLQRALVLKFNSEGAQRNELMKQIALFFSLLNLLISIYMWFQFDYNTTSYQFVYEFNNLNFCHFHVGVDGISLYFVLLTTFITPICILSN
jgi:NADH:ubiquinone oxidoreductase subunit 4 (subunit M)